MGYTIDMADDVSFSLDPKGGQEILEQMVAVTIKESAEAIANRATNIASAMSSEPPTISMTQTVGTIRRGTRNIVTIRATGKNAHQNYVGHMALAKSKDAGRI